MLGCQSPSSCSPFAQVPEGKLKSPDHKNMVLDTRLRVRYPLRKRKEYDGADSMRTQSIDTSPEFERIQITRIRTFSAEKKFKSVRSWTQSITSANLHSASGSSDDMQERDLAASFVAREYGDQSCAEDWPPFYTFHGWIARL